MTDDTALNDPATEELADLERRRARALMDADVSTLAGMLDDDLLYVHSSGGTDDKATLLSRIGDGTVVYRSVELVVDQVIAGAGTVVGRERMVASVQNGDHRIEVDSTATSVWTRGPAGLRLLVFLSVPRVPHPPATA